MKWISSLRQSVTSIHYRLTESNTNVQANDDVAAHRLIVPRLCEPCECLVRVLNWPNYVWPGLD